LIKSKNTFLALHLAFLIRFVRLADSRNTQKQDPFKKDGSVRFGGEN